MNTAEVTPTYGPGTYVRLRNPKTGFFSNPQIWVVRAVERRYVPLSNGDRKPMLFATIKNQSTGAEAFACEYDLRREAVQAG